MKTRNSFILIAFISALILAGCQKTDLFLKGEKAINFSANTISVGTKTSYSGVEITEGGRTYERINWIIGDTVRIYSPQATHRYNTGQHYADYRVYNVSEDGKKSLAKICNVDIDLNDPENDPGTGSNINGLVWGEPGTYNFYAVYPKPAAVDAQGTSGVINGTIPSTQSAILANNMPFAYMTAMATVTSSEAGKGQDVTLDFYPCFTAFQFTVGCGENESVTLRNFTLKSASQPIAGAFQANCSTGAVTTSSTAKEISVVLNTTISGTQTYTFTVFTLAQANLSGLSICFEGDEIGTRTLALDKEGSPVVFTAKNKHLINGLSFPKILTVNGEEIDWDIQAMGESLIWD